MRTLVAILAFGLGLAHSSAQLAGVYSVEADGDFTDLPTAVAQAVSQGLADSTIFEVGPGAGNLLTLSIPVIPGAAADRPLIIRSAGTDTTEVVLGPIYLMNTAHIRLEGFTIMAGGGAEKFAIKVFTCDDIEVSHCRLVEPEGFTYGYNQAMLTLRMQYEGAAADYRFNHCSIVSQHRAVWTMGSGTPRFKDCNLEGIMQWVGGPSVFEDCTIRPSTNEEVWGISFTRCSFSSPLNKVKIRGALLQDSDFECRTELSVDVVRGNRFRRVYRSFGSTLITGNIMDTVSFVFTHGEKVVGNRFHGPVSAQGDGMLFYNNSFDVGLQLEQGPGQQVRYNSFGPGAYLKTHYISGYVEFNSLWDLALVEQPSVTLLRRNNYANAGNPINFYYAAYDPIPTFHDPQYDTTAGYWKATNLLLTGRGNSNHSHAAFDIDSVPRLLPAAAGANVICVDGYLPESLGLGCGEVLALRLCANQNDMVLTPLPPDGLVSLDTVAVGGGFQVYLADTSGMVLDSCWVYRAPPMDRPLVDLWTVCDLPVSLHAPYTHQYADSVIWGPEGVFADPQLPEQILATDSTLIVTATVYTPCGSFQQPYRVNVQEVPYAYYTAITAGDTVWLSVNPNCCDSIEWDMGDDTIYGTPDVTHVYDPALSYATIILWCWRNGEMGGTVWNVQLPGVGVVELAKGAAPLRIYPNPATTHVRVEGMDGLPLTVSITLYDLMGRPVVRRAGQLPLTLDIGDLATGRYTLVAEGQDQVLRAPLVIKRD
ncbi:MAG TPA: T9SS type A sorting domain-containing protein [Flavobacteriales bacterium]|nr:T9SS type A sorting domain-containing protein [Flavobacteriales bacterium]